MSPHIHNTFPASTLDVTSDLNLKVSVPIAATGSERNKLSGATGEHFREACSINKSLTCLGRVIMELVEAQRAGKRHTHIPYRDSRLTFLLQVWPLQLLLCYACCTTAF